MNVKFWKFPHFSQETLRQFGQLIGAKIFFKPSFFSFDISKVKNNMFNFDYEMDPELKHAQ